MRASHHHAVYQRLATYLCTLSGRLRHFHSAGLCDTSPKISGGLLSLREGLLGPAGASGAGAGTCL
jgi:hypothetical protein